MRPGRDAPSIVTAVPSGSVPAVFGVCHHTRMHGRGRGGRPLGRGCGRERGGECSECRAGEQGYEHLAHGDPPRVAGRPESAKTGPFVPGLSDGQPCGEQLGDF
jgi:hypothetical protein